MSEFKIAVLVACWMTKWYKSELDFLEVIVT